MPVQLRNPVVLDRVIALVLLAVAELQIWAGSGSGFAGVASVVAPILAATVAVRRSAPLLAGLVAQATMAATFVIWGDAQVFGISIAWFLSLYALTAWTTPRSFAVGIVFVSATNALGVLGPVAKPESVVPFAVVTAVVMLLVRRVLGDRDRRLALAERERDVAAREAVVEERARIARELHDAIAHSVSMMVVQAGAERRVLGGGSTHEVLQTIEGIGRGALTEMRRLVGMLRGESGDPLTPQPGLADIETLCAQIDDAGLPVSLEVTGDRRELPVGIELSAFRIVQESLTNALKHAGRASATVRLHYGSDSLELEVVDDGTGGLAGIEGGGHGLAGMRERVALYGGRFDASPRPTGGFRVRVLLPVR